MARSIILSDNEEINLRNPDVFYTVGLKFSKDKPVKAIEYINAAISLGKDLKKCYQVRAMCYLKLGRIDESLIDIDKALSYDKLDTKSILLKAEALYSRGEFEWALMYYHQGKRLRRSVQDFQNGIDKSKEAIQSSLSYGNRVSLTPNVTNKNKNEPQHFYAEDRHKNSVTKQKFGKKLLGLLYRDFEYLNETYNQKKFSSNEKIKSLCNDGLNYLNSRLEFFKQQNVYKQK